MKRKRAPNGKLLGEKSTHISALSSKVGYKNSDIGHLVWGKVPGSRIWPGIIIHHSDTGMIAPNERSVWIFWFGDNRVSLGQLSKVYSFVHNFKKYFSSSCISVTYQRGVHEVLKICHQRSGISLNGSSLDFASLISWAMDGFKTVSNSERVFWLANDTIIPEKVMKILKRIKQVQNSDCSSQENLDEFPTASSSSESDSDSEERKVWRSKAALLKEVRKGTAFLDSICIACEKGQESSVASLHPIFQGGLCIDCKATSDSTVQDPEDELCTICCSPGEVAVCDNDLCDRVFCLGCIELLVAPSAVEKIKKMDPWLCFLCTEYCEHTHGLIIPRPEYNHVLPERRHEVIDNFEGFPDDAFQFNEDTEKRPIRIVSLFDGIATGLFVMDKLNLKVEKYIASETDENAVNISKMRFGSRISHVGDITKWSDSQVKAICPIDLLIGGSPCNDLSFVNPLRKGLFDPNGTGILFFHYFRIQKLIQTFNKDTHLFWLFENVAAMPKEYKYHISQFLNRNPVVIDAQYFSPQKRARNFWGNVP